VRFRWRGWCVAAESGRRADGARSRDAAQERGEVAKRVQIKTFFQRRRKVSVDDIGLTHKDIHEARIIRDAEAPSWCRGREGIRRRPCPTPRARPRPRPDRP